ncbi:MAG: phage terminase large subunit family protein [Devosia sp.]
MTLHFLDRVWREAISPEPQLTVSQWADAHRMLPSTASEPGLWRTSRAPYLREIMDALSTASTWERVVLMKGAQLGATEAGLNWLGYVMQHAPGTALLVMPSLDMVKRNTRTRIDPMIETTHALHNLVAPAKSRHASNTTFAKEFPGGTLVMTGANSAAALRSTPARYVFMDEVDGFPADVDAEGDPVALAVQRTVTFKGRRRIFLCSTPTVAGASRIEAAFREGDQRLYHVPCLHCGDMQPISWARVRWPKGGRHKAYLACDRCGGVMEETDKPKLLSAGEWRPTAPGDGRTASFHLSALYSPFETWAEIAYEQKASKGDPARLRAWVNLKLGEPHEDLAAKPIDPHGLLARREQWDAVPNAVVVVTAGVDVQIDRLEVEIVGWGIGEETWSLGYRVLWGDPAESQVWEDLDRIIAEPFRRQDSATLGIRAACVDTGGARTAAAYSYVAIRHDKRVWGIKGSSTPTAPPWPRRPSRSKRGGVPLYIIGSSALKEALYARLRITDPGPGYCHFPHDRDAPYFTGLTAEKNVTRYVKGVAKREWVLKSELNEPLDCRVYATAALEGLKTLGFTLEGAARDLQPGAVSVTKSVVRSKWMSR